MGKASDCDALEFLSTPRTTAHRDNRLLRWHCGSPGMGDSTPKSIPEFMSRGELIGIGIGLIGALAPLVILWLHKRYRIGYRSPFALPEQCERCTAKL